MNTYNRAKKVFKSAFFIFRAKIFFLEQLMTDESIPSRNVNI